MTESRRRVEPENVPVSGDFSRESDLLDLHFSVPLQGKDASGRGESRTDAWHIAEWDDVFWWYVADTSARHSPDLRRVAP